MNDDDIKRDGGCSCHICPPCSWCCSLDEDEADAYGSGGMESLRAYWKELDAQE